MNICNKRGLHTLAWKNSYTYKYIYVILGHKNSNYDKENLDLKIYNIKDFCVATSIILGSSIL